MPSCAADTAVKSRRAVCTLYYPQLSSLRAVLGLLQFLSVIPQLNFFWRESLSRGETKGR